ncbi:hypothetical protein GY45DRAFT_701097 [Cubamyces sp. BRFM 1775]|nr:hypothetical protein GY45DRAFT_701097 [Cubamyces sp. BRFM 1775]
MALDYGWLLQLVLLAVLGVLMLHLWALLASRLGCDCRSQAAYPPPRRPDVRGAFITSTSSHPYFISECALRTSGLSLLKTRWTRCSGSHELLLLYVRIGFGHTLVSRYRYTVRTRQSGRPGRWPWMISPPPHESGGASYLRDGTHSRNGQGPRGVGKVAHALKSQTSMAWGTYPSAGLAASPH